MSATSSSKTALPLTKTTVKQEAKETKEEKLEDAVLVDVEKKFDINEHLLAYVRRSLVMRRPKGGLSRNFTYPMEMSLVKVFTANGSGFVSGALRYGLTSDYPGFSTMASVFTRFRIVHVSLFVTQGLSDSNSSTTPHNLCVGMNVGDTSGTPSGLAGCWEIPGSVLVQVSTLPAANIGKIKPVMRSKVVPEQDWFQTVSDSQRGCFPFYGTGWTATTGDVNFWIRARFEFTGMLI